MATAPKSAPTEDVKNDGSNLNEIKDLLGSEGTGAPAVNVKEGDVCRLSTVYGLMINPLTEDAFDIGSEKKATVDGWIMLQLKAGKMVVAE